MDEDIKKEVMNDLPAADAPEALSGEQQCQKELEEVKDKNIRLLAEFENMRKRHERDRSELIKYAHEEVILEMLGFYEDFERCVSAGRVNPSENPALLKGVEMVFKRMQELLKKYDVTEIDAAGKKFDHTCHEALLAVDSMDVEDGTVLEVFQKGYMLGGRVVRTAKVKVSKKS